MPENSQKPEPFVVGATHRSSSVGLRDRLFVDDDAAPVLFERLAAAGIPQALVLSTCDRVEIQGMAPSPSAAIEAARLILAARAGQAVSEIAGLLECLTGDAFHSLRCDCGSQLDAAIERIGEEGRGVLVYLRGHEGRGIGIGHKLRAYQLQDDGADTVDANLAQGLPVDSREYGVGAQMLADLGLRRIRLMTNNPAKYGGLEGYGLEITGRVPLRTEPNPENIRYLQTKRDRMGHLLDADSDEDDETTRREAQ